MAPIEALHPARGVRIPVSDLLVRTSRSSGPGGQHANVTASRVEVVFDVLASEHLSELQKQRVSARLGPTVRAVAQDARSQIRNHEIALGRLEERLAEALRVPKARRPTKPSRGSVQRRLSSKGKRSAVKRDRRPPSGED